MKNKIIGCITGILIIGLLGILVLGVILEHNKEKEGTVEIVPSTPLVLEDSKFIPFEFHSEDGFKIPVVTLNVNGIEASFIVDTGSNGSILDYKWYEEHKNLFTFKKRSYIDYIGVSGVNTIKTVYLYGLVNGIPISFTTSDLSAIRKSLKKYGLTVVGILGSVYLEENNYVIDYKSKTIYIKTN